MLFKEPMDYFCQWIDDLIVTRKARYKHWADAPQCTQYHLVDLVQYLDRNKMYQQVRKIKRGGLWCDCEKCKTEGQEKALAGRSDSQYANKGLRPWYRYDKWDPGYDVEIDLDAMLEMICNVGFDQKAYHGIWAGTMDWKLVHCAEQECGNNSDDGRGSNEDYDQSKTEKRKSILKIKGFEKKKWVYCETWENNAEKEDHSHNYWHSRESVKEKQEMAPERINP
jgi:hypothetical protein